MSEVLKLLDEIKTEDEASLESGCVKILKKIRPAWRRSDIVLQRLNCSEICFQYLGYLGKSANEKIGLKIYTNKESPVNVENLINIMVKFSERAFSSPVYAIFSNGVAYAEVEGEILDFASSTDDQIYPIVARKVGEMHRVMSDQRKNRESPNIFCTLKQWLDNVKHTPPGFPDPLKIRTEIYELEGSIGLDKMLVTFCHGDLNPRNIIYDKIKKSVSFICSNYFGPRPRAFEIAHLFLTMYGGDHNLVGKDEYVPSRQVQTRWLNHYLAAFKGVHLHQVKIQELDLLLKQVSLCSLVYLLQETIWSLVKAENTVISGLDILTYGKLRYHHYRRIKYNILDLKI